MRTTAASHHRRLRKRTLVGVCWGLAAGLALLSACGSDNSASAPPSAAAQSNATSAPAGPAGPAAPAVSSAAAAPTAAPDLKLLNFSPDKGSAGTLVSVTGEGLPPNASATFQWATVDGSYDMTASAENVTFNKRVFKDRRLKVGEATTTADGKLAAQFPAPEDFGEVHDVYLAVDGKDVARGGFRIMRQVTLTPESGPLGTPITVKVTGLGWTQYTNTISLRYDNLPTGIITAVTTRGTTIGSIRASGKPGKHVIDINHGARSVPFLNNQQSGTANIPDWRLWFTVTDASVMPADVLEFPEPARLGANIQAAPMTTSNGKAATATVKGAVNPASGPILTGSTLTATGLPASTPIELFWVTARGNRVNPSGWSLDETSLGKATSGPDGSLQAPFQVPEDLGGWHVIKLVGGQAVLGEVPFFVQHSLFDVTPRRVRAGEQFTVHLKGIGWTELDNGVAITYDNAYIGFACGFNSGGDATINFVATGEPGIHLIDLYPMIYQGHGEPPWGYEQPLLSFKVDAPGLSLGYNLPTYRLAIEVLP